MTTSFLIEKAYRYLKAGNVDKAWDLLNSAREVAETPMEHTLCHDLGNAIQREIFESYMQQPS